MSNIKHSLLTGRFNKVLHHIHWSLMTDLFPGTLVKTFQLSQKVAL